MEADREATPDELGHTSQPARPGGTPVEAGRLAAGAGHGHTRHDVAAPPDAAGAQRAADLSERFQAVRDWVQAIVGTAQIRIQWREWKHRVQGTQQVPAAVYLDTLQDALAFIGKTHEALQFEAVWQQTAAAQPVLLAWLLRRPTQALEVADRWERLLAVVAWLQAHPRPGVYLRQVDVPGVDSKFIEAHKSVLTALLDLALPPESIDTAANGVRQFTRRFGFLDKPVPIRFRLLDAALPGLPGWARLPDISLDAAHFAALTLPITRVFIIENEISFLTFPKVAGAIVIFGAGYGWEQLARAAWLHACQLYYWGDMDTHGFTILNRLRGYFGHVTSVLMDQDTLLAHRVHWDEESSRHARPWSTSPRKRLPSTMTCDTIATSLRLRLEQERIGFRWVCDRLACLLSAPPQDA